MVSFLVNIIQQLKLETRNNIRIKKLEFAQVIKSKGWKWEFEQHVGTLQQYFHIASTAMVTEHTRGRKRKLSNSLADLLDPRYIQSVPE